MVTTLPVAAVDIVAGVVTTKFRRGIERTWVVRPEAEIAPLETVRVALPDEVSVRAVVSETKRPRRVRSIAMSSAP